MVRSDEFGWVLPTGKSGEERHGWAHSRSSAYGGCLAHSKCSQKPSVPITIIPGIRDAVLGDSEGHWS